MFICEDCGAVFEEPKTEYEDQGEYFGAPAWEAYGVCPNCGSTEYDEATQCERCGEWTTDPHHADIILCGLCYDELYE